MPAQPVPKLHVVTPSEAGKPELSIQVEPFWTVAEECPKLIRANAKETGRHVSGLPFDLDWNALLQSSRTGQLVSVTLRDGDHLVGYVATQLGPHSLYRSTLHGFILAVWLHPDYRHGFNALKLLRQNETILKQSGVKRLVVAEPLHFRGRHGKRLRVLFQRLGYSPFEAQWDKML